MHRPNRPGDNALEIHDAAKAELAGPEPLELSERLATRGLSRAVERWRELTGKYRSIRWASYAVAGAGVILGAYEIADQLVHFTQSLINHSMNNLTDIIPLKGSDGSQAYPDFSGYAPIPTDAPAHPLTPDMVS